MDYLLIIVAAICISVNFCIEKLYQLKIVKNKIHLFFYYMLHGLFTVILFLLINNFKLNYSPFSLLMAILFSLFVTTYSVLGMIAIKYGKLSIYTTFLMIGGMLIPYLYGIIFLHEELSIYRIVGMVLLIGSLVLDALLSKKEEVKIKPIFWIICILVFLLNGGVSTVSKAHQININSVPTNDFIVWGAIIKTIISAIGFIFLLIFYKKDETKIQEIKETNYSLGVLIVTMGVIVGGVGTLLLLESAKTLPASMQYPFVTGGSTIITAILSRLLYKEKISSIQIVSLVILLIGTILFLF